MMPTFKYDVREYYVEGDEKPYVLECQMEKSEEAMVASYRTLEEREWAKARLQELSAEPWVTER